ncbi:MAG: extensin family protein [Rhizobiales bacterium]|nr:extensin family protein [Hyphomicrobiales bacterium]
MAISSGFRLAAIFGIGAVLSACSLGGGRSFDTQGLMAPPAQCSIKPSDVGVAERMSAIDEGNGCRVPNPWRVSAIANVSFSEPATLNCGMADPLNDWLRNVVDPAAQRNFGESVMSVDIVASYDCRARNNESGAKMSEHGFGNAIDIAAFNLASGRKVSVKEGWYGSAAERGFLRLVRQQACNDFMTVLGPGSDSYHRDHFHLDLQNRGSGGHYCQ